VLPELVLDELQRVMAERLDFEEEQIHVARELLGKLAANQPAAPARVDPVTGDPADDAILACAVEATVDVLATGDRKHLLPIGEYRGVRIRTPQAVLAELRAQE
jgi:predicted nucleic acid-binding protein